MSISTEITRLQTAKADIKTAIENKGVTVPSDAKLDTYDDYVAQISTGIVPSGNIELQQQTGTNVTNYATASVKTGSATVTGSAQQSAPTFSRSGTTVTASVAAKTIKAIPLVSAGWVDSGTEGTVTMSANSATYTIPSGSATTPATTKAQSTPSFSKSGNVITASVAATSVSVTPSVSAGWVSSGTAGTVTMSASSNTYTIPTETKTATANGTVTPTSGKYLTSVTVSIPTYSDLS